LLWTKGKKKRPTGRDFEGAPGNQLRENSFDERQRKGKKIKGFITKDRCPSKKGTAVKPYHFSMTQEGEGGVESLTWLKVYKKKEEKVPEAWRIKLLTSKEKKFQFRANHQGGKNKKQTGHGEARGGGPTRKFSYYEYRPGKKGKGGGTRE